MIAIAISPPHWNRHCKHRRMEDRRQPIKDARTIPRSKSQRREDLREDLWVVRVSLPNSMEGRGKPRLVAACRTKSVCRNWIQRGRESRGRIWAGIFWSVSPRSVQILGIKYSSSWDPRWSSSPPSDKSFYINFVSSNTSTCEGEGNMTWIHH